MRPNPIHASADPQFVRDLIAANPWATIVSVNDGRPVASHYPILLDDSTDGLATSARRTGTSVFPTATARPRFSARRRTCLC